jgi:hypothetical protein
MHKTLLVMFVSAALGGVVYGQSMLETSAAAAGGSVGGVAGKKVSDGLTKIFEKVDKQAAKAAKTGETKKSSSAASRNAETDPNTPLLEVGPGVPKGSSKVVDTSNVPPPPPPAHRASVHKPAPPPVAAPVVEPPPPVIAPPPPPDVTADDLKHLTSGMQRADVLKLGSPSSRITMFEEGHLLEIFRYQAKDMTLGVVRLTDGSVSNILLR